jgi:hypothetical protein
MTISQFAIGQTSQSIALHPREQEAIGVASDWLDLVEGGDDKKSYAMLAPIFQRSLTPVSWRMSVAERNVKSGKRLSRMLRRVVWYDNPTDAPLPGLYAAVEFDSKFENTDQHFQFVILHSQGGAPFLVMRNEVTAALKKSSEGASTAQLVVPDNISNTYDVRWRRLSGDADRLTNTSSGQMYERSITTVHNKFWAGVVAKCGEIATRAGISQFQAIAVIDQSGEIAEFLPMPNTQPLNCIVKEMIGRHYPAPPSQSYLIRYSIDLTTEKSQ